MISINKGKLTKRLNRILLYICVILIVFFFMAPFYWIFITSIQPEGQLYQKDQSIIPEQVTLENYKIVLGIGGEQVFGSGKYTITSALKNTFVVAAFVTVISIFLGVFTAYAFSRLKFKGSNIIFAAIIFTEMIPPVALLLPFYLLFRALNLTNTLTGLVIFYTAWLLPIVTWILYGYFKTIPRDLEDSARIDGATRIGAIFKIIMPITIPGIISAGVICFVFSMGEFMGAMAIINREAMQTVPLALARYIGKFTIKYGMITASAILAVTVPVLFILLFQRFIVKGLTSGAVKE